jgi:hypothetical protein
VGTRHDVTGEAGGAPDGDNDDRDVAMTTSISDLNVGAAPPSMPMQAALVIGIGVFVLRRTARGLGLNRPGELPRCFRVGWMPEPSAARTAIATGPESSRLPPAAPIGRRARLLARAASAAAHPARHAYLGDDRSLSAIPSMSTAV